ncbi:hypothetical protein HK097_005492 [Rhizophlyctis rosea]|uniref:Uncharacterized protein n=1 Tax=Rhizophlyctis rosea TaxID=64517 RepID=A0AAD5SFG1_9FUNG|nr:hypothetical protein HK097_005492 [Rhizophlyctis rosea]
MLDRFPYPVLSQITSYIHPLLHHALIPPTKAFEPLLIVSRAYFHTFAPYYWQHLSLTVDTIPLLHRTLSTDPLLPYHDYITSIHIGEGCADEMLQHMLAWILERVRGARIREFKIEKWEFSCIPMETLKMFVKRHEEIRNVRLGPSSTKLLCSLPNVEHVDLHEACLPCTPLKRVRHLKMSHTCYYPTVDPCECQFVTDMPALRSLDLTVSDFVRGETILKAVGGALEEVRVVSDHPGLIIKAVVEYCPKLKSLKLAPGPFYSVAPPNVRSTHCWKLKDCCPDLEEVVCPDIMFSIAGLESLLECSGLNRFEGSLGWDEVDNFGKGVGLWQKLMDAFGDRFDVSGRTNQIMGHASFRADLIHMLRGSAVAVKDTSF